MQAPCSGNELLTPRPFHFWPKIELLLYSGTTLGSCVAFPSNGKFREVAPPLSRFVALRPQSGPQKQCLCPGHIL